MLISVVIPAYNAEKILRDAVISVIQQTAISSICEIIIVDDGSSDHTFQVMQEVKEEFSMMDIILIHKENGGASGARNVGISKAKGDWIALLDADDEWLPNKIECQMAIIEKHSEIDFLGCGSDNRTLKILFRKIDQLHKATIQELCIKNYPVTPSIIFRKSIIDDIGGFDETRKYMEDNEFCLRVCEKYGYYYLPKSLVKTGHGKKAIGDAGLSSNVKGMYLGRVQNMKDLYARKTISASFYLFCRVFNLMKYMIRKVL